MKHCIFEASLYSDEIILIFAMANAKKVQNRFYEERNQNYIDIFSQFIIIYINHSYIFQIFLFSIIL